MDTTQCYADAAFENTLDSGTGDPLETLRKICLELPEATERLSHGEPTWFVQGKKSFVTYADHHHDDRLALWCAAPEGIQQMLVNQNPERYFVPPYVGVRGWIGVRLDTQVDWEEAAGLVTEAYLCVAPRKLRARILEITEDRTTTDI